MLKGYIDCKGTKNLLLRYINFELKRNEMEQIATHLRNCPMCMEEYARMQLRKKNLRQKMKAIEKKLRIENELTAYFDNETTEKTKKLTENMIKTDKDYKIEFEELKNMLVLLHKAEDNRLKEMKYKKTNQIIAKLRAKNIKKIRVLNKVKKIFF